MGVQERKKSETKGRQREVPGGVSLLLNASDEMSKSCLEGVVYDRNFP